ncbi:prolipoprotein diacylglyceryl transferase [Trueperella bialowiezensis]|uniref:Uncharacterized protein n=1 Tax=Trueperella bialowiezensis TaxID=312285 RepID=A0A3S4Z625_9ACTO|nr:hypothetical protein [Trueperella bialowiezensis]VEI13774.1 Uncharacterised protein [Trueperella bialowiezensis]
MKRKGGFIFVFLGIALATFGFLRSSMTAKPDTVEVTVPSSEAQMAYTAPGVLSLVNDVVDVTLSVPEGTVHWGVGATADVEAFVGDASAIQVTGLADWETPAYELRSGTQEGADAVAKAVEESRWNIHESDMWEESGSGEGSVTIALEPDQRVRQSLIVSTSAGTVPEMTFTWQRQLTAINPVPWIIIGALTSLIGVLMVMSANQEAGINRKRAAKYSERLQRQESATAVLTKVDVAREEAAAQTAGALGAAVLPGANEDIRNRPLDEGDRLVIPPAQDDDGERASEPEELTNSDEPAETEDQPADPEEQPAELDDSPAGESAESADEQGDEPTDGEEESEAESKDDDWRSLWNFNWGSPWKKGEDDA